MIAQRLRRAVSGRRHQTTSVDRHRFHSPGTGNRARFSPGVARNLSGTEYGITKATTMYLGVSARLCTYGQKKGAQGPFRAPSSQDPQLSRCARSSQSLFTPLIFSETPNHDLLSLQWSSAPRNILLVKKNDAPAATDALLEFAQYTGFLCSRS